MIFHLILFVNQMGYKNIYTKNTSYEKCEGCDGYANISTHKLIF